MCCAIHRFNFSLSCAVGVFICDIQMMANGSIRKLVTVPSQPMLNKCVAG